MGFLWLSMGVGHPKGPIKHPRHSCRGFAWGQWDVNPSLASLIKHPINVAGKNLNGLNTISDRAPLRTSCVAGASGAGFFVFVP